MINELDNWLLAEGSHKRPYEILGAHFTECDNVAGVKFSSVGTKTLNVFR